MIGLFIQIFVDFRSHISYPTQYQCRKVNLKFVDRVASDTPAPTGGPE
jgi:hypothetical protein